MPPSQESSQRSETPAAAHSERLHLIARRVLRETGRLRWLDWGPVPAALREQAVRRLGALALLVAGLFLAFSALTITALRHAYLEQTARFFASPLFRFSPPILAGACVVLSVLLWRLTRCDSIDRKRLLDIGVAYQILMAGVLGFLHNLHTWAGFDVYTGWSHAAVVTIVFAVVVPATPGRALATAAATALMDPLSLLATIWAGAPWPSNPVLAMLLVPDLFAIVFASFIASIVHGIGRQLERAEQMGSYRLVQRLGQGGMGEVWRAEHHTLARPAAIKLIRPDALGDSARQAQSAAHRFEREAQATALLSSPHTIRVYDFGVSQDGSFYYVMELLDGIDLEQYVERFGPMPPERVVHVLRQACHSLAEAHARGLVHRDVKPANIYLCRQGLDYDQVKVLDFGLVKPMHEGELGDAKITQQGQITGTPTYLAPEQALGTEAIDGRTDLYSLGCVATWLLTGRTVFSAGTLLGQLIAHRTEMPEPVSTKVPVPSELDTIVARCLAKRPEDRFPDAYALRAALAAVPLGSEWTHDNAEQWWRDHLPAPADVAKREVEVAPTLPVDALRDDALEHSLGSSVETRARAQRAED